MQFKKVFKVLFVLSLFVILFAAPTIVSAMGQPAAAVQEVALPDLSDLAKTAKSLGGFALLFAALINIGKTMKPEWFPNNSAPTYNLIFEFLLLAGLVFMQLTGRTDLVPVFDQNAGILANSITGLFALYFQLYLSRLGHEKVLAGFPVIGKSYSNRAASSFSKDVLLATPKG